MSKKEHKNPKQKIWEELQQRDEVFLKQLKQQGLEQLLSLRECINWIQPFIEHSSVNAQDRLDGLIRKLEDEFPLSNTDDLRIDVQTVIIFLLNNSIMLYALDMNGPAIIELHGVLERQAIETLVQLILLPENAEIGRRIIERYRLPEVAAILNDYGILDKDNIKFVQKLTRLRDGLAHRNAKKISNAVFSGRPIEEEDINFLMADVDYIPLAIKAVNFLTKILDVIS